VGTSGKLAQYLYTKEAFESLLDHLTPEGVLVIYNGSKAQALVNFRKIFEDRNWGNLQNRVIIVRGKTSSSPELKGLGSGLITSSRR
jgi:spermidine synthase